MSSLEHMPHSELMTRAPLFFSKMDNLFPLLLEKSQTDETMGVSMRLTGSLRIGQDNTIRYFRDHPRETMAKRRTITVSSPCADGRLRIDQKDQPGLINPRYEVTLFDPPANSDPLDHLEREISILKHERDGISIQLQTALQHNATILPDITVNTYHPSQPGEISHNLGLAGGTVGTRISLPAYRLQNTYNETALPRLNALT